MKTISFFILSFVFFLCGVSPQTHEVKKYKKNDVPQMVYINPGSARHKF